MLQQFNLFLSDLSSQVSIPIDIIKTILVLLVNIILSNHLYLLIIGPTFILLKSPFLRALYSLFIGLFQLYFLLGFDAWYVISTSVMVYIFVKIFNKSPFLVSALFSAIFLTIVHLHRFIFDYSSWKVDCSVYVMILVTKLTYYGHACQQKPYKGDVLQYFSYCFYFPSIIAGPTFSYERFLDFINLEKQYKNIKFSLRNTITTFILGVIAGVITALVMPVFDHEWVLRNEQYLNLPFIGKILAINIIGFFYRIKFYVAWYIAQTAVNISGLSYSENGKNDSVIAGSFMFEIQPNPKNKIEYWSASIQVWLRVVVYDNIAKYSKNQSFALFGTFLTSAFWHGIYLTYYIGFFQWAVLTYLTKFIYKASFFLSQKIRGSIFTTILMYVGATISLNYIGMGVVLLEWQNMIKFYSQLYFFITIIMGIILVLSFVIKPPRQTPRGSKPQIKPSTTNQKEQKKQ